MKYSKFQKIISYILLFVFFLNISVNIPSIFSLVLARESSFYNLVSIIVDEKTYEKIKGELDRYGRDISGVLENTKVVILPVPENASPFKIASMNEAMFFGGYKSLYPVDFESKLISTVFVGNIPLPTVYKGENFTRTALPYVDFEEKLYIFDREKNRYEESNSGNSEIKPEIEFSFISPNTGSFEENIKSLKNFFEKNHDYYTGQGLYKKINGLKDDNVSYEPYVFYYDYFRETNGFNPNLYSLYLATREKNEDLIYGRYTKDLLGFMEKAFKKEATQEMLSLSKVIGQEITLAQDNSSKKIYDIQSRLPIEKLKKNFINSFSKGTLGDLRKNVFNAGRYNFGQNVNVDFIPHIVSKIDILADQIIKEANDDLEKQVNGVIEKISRKIAVPVSVDYYYQNGESEHFKNYLFGIDAGNILKAENCSFYRGDKQLVEANRGINIKNIQPDIDRLNVMGTNCLRDLDKDAPGLNGLWGKNSPLYLNKDFSDGELKLKSGTDIKGAIEPLFDIKGAVKVKNGTPINSLQCFDNNYLLNKKLEYISPSGLFIRNKNDDNLSLEVTYDLKLKDWSCQTDNNLDKTYNFEHNYIENEILEFNDKRNNTTCDIEVYLDGKLIRKLVNEEFYRKQEAKRNSSQNGDKEEIKPNCKKYYKYKSVDSVIIANEPTPATIKAQAEDMITPNLPIDNRRIEFVRADGAYGRYYYPNLFEVGKGDGLISEAEKSIKNYIGGKNLELKNIFELGEILPPEVLKKLIYEGKVSNLVDKNDEISDILLKVKPYPRNYNPIGLNLTQLSYAVLWNNLSTSRKYSLIFEKYLSDDLTEFQKDKPNFSLLSNIFKENVSKEDPESVNLNFLPNLKQNYEISYLGANGDAQNMMIKFDPKLKEKPPFGEIISKNEKLSSFIFGHNIANSGIGGKISINLPNDLDSEGKITGNSPFKCAPPDGVPIWEWPDAIACWIKDMLPPKIKISSGECTINNVIHDKLKDKENIFNLNNFANSCYLDKNLDGISDCLEKVDTLILKSNSSSYSYNDYISLKASFFEGENKATFVNNTSVSFEIIKIEKAKDESKELSTKNLEIVYDVTNNKLNDEKILLDLLDFSKGNKTIASLGDGIYGFTSKNKDLNVYVKAKSVTKGINPTVSKVLDSKVIKIEIRGKNLSTSSSKYLKSGKKVENTSTVVEASDKTNIFIFDLKDKNLEESDFEKYSKSEETLFITINSYTKSGKYLDLKYPLNVKLFSKNDLVQDLDIQSRQNFIELSPLTNSGNYTLKITDGNGFSTEREITVSPSQPEKIDLKLGSTSLLSGGSTSTNILTIYDKYNNPVSGKNYDFDLNLDNKNFVFIDETKGETSNIKLSIFEGFKIFRLKTGKNHGTTNLKINLKDSATGKEILTKTEKIESINFVDINLSTKTFSVGGDSYKFKVSIVDKNGKIISGINSRIYISGGKNYFETNKDYFEIKDGEAELEISTKNLSGKNIPIEFQIEGINKIFNKKIDIGASLPVKLDILIADSKIEAKPNKYSTVYLELKDKYNNTVTSDSTTKAKIEIDNNSGQILTLDSSEVKFENGLASFKIYGTYNPGVGYFKVSTEPTLEKNFFEINGGNKNIKINGVGENIGKIETFYFWNKEKIRKQNYNSLYTVLSGANYGDISVQDYLAGSLIFDKDSKALAVTTLLESPEKKDNILSIDKSGNIKNIFAKSDLSQFIKSDFGIEDGKIFFDIYNKALNVNVGKIVYNLKDLDISTCENDLKKCFSDKKSSVVGLTDNDKYNFYLKGDNLVFIDNFGKEIFSIDKKGNFEKKSDVKFEINSKNFEKFLELKIFIQGEFVGSLGINLLDVSDVIISRDEKIFEKKKELLGNSILLKLESTLYGGFKSGQETVVFYKDPFASKNSLNNFSKKSNYGFENFKNKEGIGWKDDNKTLLSFASGKTVGASVKDFMGIYTINIGDPFVKLKKQKKGFTGASGTKQFDSTIGKILSNNEDVVNYKVFDYNNDGKTDIILVKMDNYIELLENVNAEENFINRGNLVQIYDLGNFIEAGDFTGDKFDDIFFVGKDGKPYLLNNVEKDFSRVDLSKNFDLKGKIVQVSVFDMDNDGIKDVVTIDEGGDLNIFYGSGNSKNPTFVKKNITSGLGVSLSDSARIDGSAIFYEGLLQPKYNYSFKSAKNSQIDNILVDSEIFVSVPYQKENKKITSFDSIKEEVGQVSFLKSEYFSANGLYYEKNIKDRNGGSLLEGDFVDIEIKLKNNSGKRLSKIAFLEKFEIYFDIDFKSIKNSKNLEIKSGLGNYNFLIDDFSLDNGETLTINYTGKSKKLLAFTLRTGLFEKGEPGDDLFGDIIIDDLNDKCGVPLGIYKSISKRTYEKDAYNEKCIVSELSKEFQKLNQDENKNKIPDYIEKMFPEQGTTSISKELKDYSKKELANINKDSDNDGIPDETDYFDNKNTTGLQKIEDGLDKAQELLDGLSCGFSNGACISMPMNWAPLAPGSDPVFMGKLVGDGLRIDEGLPIFSALTGMYYGAYWGPAVWPPSPLAFENNGTTGAGGWLGTDSPSNFFRVFVTPTLTGAVGTAICLGGPASVVGNVPGPFAPLFPGGNCIILTKPLFGCSNDGSDGNPEEIGIPDNLGDFSLINSGYRTGKSGLGFNGGSSSSEASCSANTGGRGISKDYVEKYLKSDGGKTDSKHLGIGKFKEALENHSKYDGSPLFNIGGGNGNGIFVGLAPAGEGESFGDIIEISKERIKTFPAFLMDWVTRQIEEIISKLTDFPTLFIILPDFSGIYDSDLSWKENLENYMKKNKKSSSIDFIDNSKVSSVLKTENETYKKLLDGTRKTVKSVNSGIKEAYEFISSLPLINLESEVIELKVPWLSEVEFNRAKYSWLNTIEQWKEELERFNNLDNISDEFKGKVNLQVNGLIGSINKNLKVIEEYKKFPDEIKKFINKKEDYLEQILCNIEIVSDLMGGWIGKNGERFKAWVELFILIKAILKSWQAFIDIFINYEQECKECKNERGDSIDWQLQIISMIVPEIPVVKFPKWPDIVLDLHNIRASIELKIPEFNISTRPINLPDLPNIYLPAVPDLNGGLNFPDIPILPNIKLPELPDLPTLPKIELPNLPPPPKLPKLFEGFEFIIDIAKLVTKAMCILKTSPFHPEKRAGDQIAFLTERNGFLGLDFLNKSIPQFTIPFIDSINITTYVNFEFEADFILELARNAVKPVNSFTSDFTNKLKISVDDIDLGKKLPGSIDVNVDASDVLKETSFEKNTLISDYLSKIVLQKVDKMKQNTSEEVSNEEFKKGWAKLLASEKISGNPLFDDLRETWREVERYNFSGEDELIKNLQKFNFEKYDTLKNIIITERVKNQNLRKNFEIFSKNPILKVSSVVNSSTEKYNQELYKFNEKTFENIGKIFNENKENSQSSEIKDLGDSLKNRFNDVFSPINKHYETESTPLENYKKANNLLAVNNSSRLGVGVTQDGASCSAGKKSGNYGYNYSGIYVLEDGKSYRLFDYIDEVTGQEKMTSIDFDNDGDKDILYFVNNTLYLKENLKNKDTKKVYLNQAPIVLNSSSNKFLTTNFIEAVNYFKEDTISNSMINASFLALKDIYNYRMTYFDIVDKYSDEKRNEKSIFRNKNIVDGIVDTGNVNLVDENNFFITRKNLVYIKNISHFRGIEMKTKKLKSIKEDLLSGKTVTITSGTKLYAGLNNLDIKYIIDGEKEIKNLRVLAGNHIELKKDLLIVGLTGDGFVETGEDVIYNSDEIAKLKGLPILFDTKIYFSGDKSLIRDNTYLDLKYYDGAELRLDFNEVYSWELYDLGPKIREYLFSISKENDYYYARINGFKSEIEGTISNQILLSPQLKADKNSPDIDLNSVKIAIYQKQKIDITEKILEDSGIAGISKIYIDFFLDKDTDGDGNPTNDVSNFPNFSVSLENGKIFLNVGEFNSLVKRKVGLNVVDINGNIGFKEFDFEVYSPIPEIESYDGVTISGTIGEELKNEPINFYRFRAGSISKLGDEKNRLTVYTTDKGEYSLKTGLFKGGLNIKDKSGKEIATISEKTGKININSINKSKFDIYVSIKKDTNFPEISIKDKSLKNIFSQILRVTGNSKVSLVDNFDKVEKNGVYIKTYGNNNLSYFVLPENILNNPGVFVGYKSSDKSQTPIFKVYPDGRIEFPEKYKLQYSDYKNYIVIEVYEENNRVLDIFYKLDADYLVN